MLVTNENIGYALSALQASPIVGVDTETTGLDVRNKRDYLMGVCVSVEGFDGYLPFRHKEDNLEERWFYIMMGILETKELDWCNMKFDYHSLATMGYDPLRLKGQQYCWQQIAQLVDEEAYSKELEELSKKWLKDGKDGSDIIHGYGQAYGYENIPATVMAPYGGKDAQLTRRLRKPLWAEMVKQELTNVWYKTEEPFAKILYSVEQRGVGVNQPLCQEYATRGRSRMATIVRELGFSPSSPKQLGNYLLNELGLPVFKHTKSCKSCLQGYPVDSHSGPPSFDKKAMEQYDDILQESSNQNARRVAEYRGWQKATTSLYEPLLEKVGPDGLIRTNFKQHGTVTGRVSATDPNLQQVPRGSDKAWNGKAKACFTSGRPGFTLIGWDYSQLELRLAASYGQEQVLLTEFKSESADPFSVLAPIIFGLLTPETRHDTKTFVYANLYGAGIKKIALQLGRPVHEVEELYENYKNGIPGIIRISKQVDNLVKRRGFVKYWDGRRRHFRNKNDSYKAWNSLCQGGGAQLVKKAMIRCLEFEDENCFMVLQVHDEITFAIRTEMIEHYRPLIEKAMTDWPDMGVTLHVEGKEWKAET